MRDSSVSSCSIGSRGLVTPVPHVGRRISRRSWAYLACEGLGGGRDPQQGEDLQLESVELGFEDLESSASASRSMWRDVPAKISRTRSARGAGQSRSSG